VLLSQAPRDGVILIEPVAGPEFIRQLMQRNLVNQMIAFGTAPRGRAAMTAAWKAGATVDLDGFAFSARLWADLQAAAPSAVVPSATALVITTGSDTAAADACQRLLPAAERIGLRLPAFWNTVGHVDVEACLQAAQTWLGKQARNREPLNREPLNREPVNREPEQPVSFAASGGTVRGVLHVPAAPSPAGRPRRILFLPGWSGDRTGPHRMFVHAARRLAAAGHTCLRFDYRGRGDSDGVTPQATIASMVADTRAALVWLRDARPEGGPLVLMAICSGCKVAITAAADAPDVGELVLWSAESMGSLRAAGTNRRKTWHSLRAYARKLWQIDSWRKLLRGQVRTDMVRKALVQHETRSAGEARCEDEVLRAFRSYGGRILFTFGSSDPDAPGSSAAYQDFCSRHHIVHTCLTVPHAGHSYYAAEWEQQVLDATVAFLGAE
jgi:pimeloyl-ACP methyl ester carboxylesterase